MLHFSLEKLSFYPDYLSVFEVGTATKLESAGVGIGNVIGDGTIFDPLMNCGVDVSGKF
jgi:hypothetical protein